MSVCCFAPHTLASYCMVTGKSFTVGSRLMTSEQLLLEKWHSLPEPQQKMVLDFVLMLHNRKPLPANNSEPSPLSRQIADGKLPPLDIPESERQRVLARIKQAQRERPETLKRMKQRQQKGWEAARKIAQMLKQDYGVKRVVLFGSLLNHEYMHDYSDIDIAVWGLDNRLDTRAWTAANYILSPYEFPPLDLVPIEKAYPEIREAIERQGVEL